MLHEAMEQQTIHMAKVRADRILFSYPGRPSCGSLVTIDAPLRLACSGRYGDRAPHSYLCTGRHQPKKGLESFKTTHRGNLHVGTPAQQVSSPERVIRTRSSARHVLLDAFIGLA
jgi:hypothetical protein